MEGPVGTAVRGHVWKRQQTAERTLLSQARIRAHTLASCKFYQVRINIFFKQTRVDKEPLIRIGPFKPKRTAVDFPIMFLDTFAQFK